MLANEQTRATLVEEAMGVLREAGDPRVSGAAPQPAPLSIDVVAIAAASDWGGMGAAPMRISPRASSNPYASNNILMLG